MYPSSLYLLLPEAMPTLLNVCPVFQLPSQLSLLAPFVHMSPCLRLCLAPGQLPEITVNLEKVSLFACSEAENSLCHMVGKLPFQLSL